jgi:hypothetical protein
MLRLSLSLSINASWALPMHQASCSVCGCRGILGIREGITKEKVLAQNGGREQAFQNRGDELLEWLKW